MAERTLTYFISDLHIGAGYIADSHEHQRRLSQWLESIAPRARTIYMLGDILDYWYEYRSVVPRGYIRFLGTLARLADEGVEIVWFKGNHDIWIFDYLPREIGMRVVDGLLDTRIDGKRFVMEHGDGVGELRRSYRIMRRLFRNRILQKLFSAIHPRWTVGFAHSWSKHSRLNGCAPRPIEKGDPMIDFAEKYMSDNGHVDYFIFGHRHVEADVQFSDNSRLIVLGDGFRQMTYGVWDGTNFSLKKMENCQNATI